MSPSRMKPEKQTELRNFALHQYRGDAAPGILGEYSRQDRRHAEARVWWTLAVRLDPLTWMPTAPFGPTGCGHFSTWHNTPRPMPGRSCCRRSKPTCLAMPNLMKPRRKSGAKSKSAPTKTGAVRRGRTIPLKDIWGYLRLHPHLPRADSGCCSPNCTGAWPRPGPAWLWC